jgi:glycosyltransferase involved in cell wall biosynthesis
MLLTRSRTWRKVPPRKIAGPLRCLFVTTSMPVGGAETLLVNLIRGLDHKQFQPEVVCLKEPGPLGDEISDEFPLHTDLLASKWDIRVLPRLIRLFHSRRADVVVTVGAGDKMFWGRLAAHIAGVPAIASALHSTGWPDSVNRLNRSLTGITDAFIGIADSHSEYLRNCVKFPDHKVHVIRNGIDCSRFVPCPSARLDVRRELGLADQAPLIGVVAALRSEKNLGMFVRAAKKLRRSVPDAHWLIVGDGPQRPAIASLADILRMKDRIHLLGTRHDTPRLLAALDVFTLCSVNEASPVSILEALSCGVPVVATDVGSVKETVIDGETGLLVPSQDVEAMTAAVKQLLSSAELRCSMGTAGRELVLRTGSLQSMVEGYQRMMLELYDARVAVCAASSKAPARKKLTTN